MSKYSKKTITAAEKFLADYQLDLNALNEPQKKAVLGYVHATRGRLLVYILFIISLVVSITGASIYYSHWHNLSPNVASAITNSEAVTSTAITDMIFKTGFTFGMHLWGALYMLVMLVLFPILLKGKLQIISAFLPLLKQTSSDVQPTADC